MKKLVLILTVVALVLAGVFISVQLSNTGLSASGPGVSPLARLVLKASEDAAFKPWLKRVARILAERSITERRYLRRLTDRLTNRPKLAKGITQEGLFQLIFPHAASGTGSGVVIKNSALVINTTGSNAIGMILLRKQDGSDLVVSTNLGTSSRFDFSLGPGEILRLETDGSGDLQVGWIEVLSDVPLSGSGTFAIFTPDGEFLSEVGIGASAGSSRFMLFVDLTDGKSTGFAICNPNPNVSISLELRLKSLAGETIETQQIDLGPLNQTSMFVSDLFAVEAGFKGVLIVTADSSDFSVVTLRTRGVRFTSLPAAEHVTDVDDEGTLFFARIGDGVFGTLLLSTSFILMNNSDTDAEAVLTIFAADGSSLSLRLGDTTASSFELVVPAGCAVELSSDGSTNPGAVGWTLVTSDIPINGGAAFTIRDLDSNSFISEVGVPSSPLTSRLWMFAEVKGDTDPGVGISNPFGFPLKIRARLLRSVTGAVPGSASSPLENVPETVVAETLMDLGMNEHTGLFVSQLFPGVPEVANRDFQGVLARIDHRFGNEGDFGRPERFSESFSIDPVQVE